MKVLLDCTNVIIAFGTDNNYSLETNGYKLNNGLFPFGLGLSVVDIETIPDNIQPCKYCYTLELGFYSNINYVDYVGDVEMLKQQNAAMLLALVINDIII